MKRLVAPIVALALLLPLPASTQQENRYDYWQFNREMIQRGQQAILMCNGLFTSDRTLEQVYQEELAYLRNPIGTAEGGDYLVDWDRRGVAIGAAEGREAPAPSAPQKPPYLPSHGLSSLHLTAPAATFFAVASRKSGWGSARSAPPPPVVM